MWEADEAAHQRRAGPSFLSEAWTTFEKLEHTFEQREQKKKIKLEEKKVAAKTRRDAA